MRPYFYSPLILQKLIWVPTNLILGIFGRMEINSLENLRGIPRNALFALNHSSELDVFLLPAALPFWSRFSPIFYTSREREFYKNAGWRQAFYGGAFFNSWGAYSVKVGLHDYASSLENHVRILNAGGSVCIFPEGRTTRDGTIGEGKGGVAYLSYATKVPIVPVRLGGTYRVGFWEFFSFGRKLSITFGKPVYDLVTTESMPPIEVLKAEANKVMDAIRGL